jgi:hypothetical protein
MSSIDAICNCFLELEWKFGKFFIGQNIGRNGKYGPEVHIRDKNLAERMRFVDSL